jgi:hypothetical protein
MQITFKSGAQIKVDVDKFTVGTSSVTDRLTSLRWTTPRGWSSKLSYLASLDDIAAIVTVDDGMESFQPAEDGETSDSSGEEEG